MRKGKRYPLQQEGRKVRQTSVYVSLRRALLNLLFVYHPTTHPSSVRIITSSQSNQSKVWEENEPMRTNELVLSYGCHQIKIRKGIVLLFHISSHWDVFLSLWCVLIYGDIHRRALERTHVVETVYLLFIVCPRHSPCPSHSSSKVYTLNRCRHSYSGLTILILLQIREQWHLLSVHPLEKVWSESDENAYLWMIAHEQ